MADPLLTPRRPAAAGVRRRRRRARRRSRSCARPTAPTPRRTGRCRWPRRSAATRARSPRRSLAAADLDRRGDGRDRRAGLPQPDARPAFIAGARRRRRRRRAPRHRARSTAPERVVVDYSAPNVAKEMHIGHLRTTAIGDALVRMLDAVGHDVVRENHIGDWGRPVRHAHRAPRRRRRRERAEHARASATSTRSTRRPTPSSTPAATSRTGPAGASCCCSSGDAGDDRAVAGARRPERARTGTRSTRKLGVLLTDDDIAGESRYEALMPEVIERLRGGRPARRSPTAPRSCSRPASPTARASRCR